MVKRINFDHISGSSINKAFINQALKLAGNIHTDPQSFHAYGRKAKAKIEEARNFFANSFNVQTNELFFHGSAVEQTKMLINYAILILKINDIISSVFEKPKILEYLKILEKNNHIHLSFIPTKKYGSIDKEALNEFLANKKKSLLCLSHVNEYSGLLLPVKDIAKSCEKHHIFFHLNIKHTVGKYPIDIQKLKPDFLSFDLGSHHGPQNAGVFYMKQSTAIEDTKYNQLKNTLKNDEKNDIFSLLLMVLVYQQSISELSSYQKKCKLIRNYLMDKLNKKFDLTHLLYNYQSQGLYTIINYYFPHQNFGRLIAEKLDIKGINIGKMVHPELIINETDLLRFSISGTNTFHEVDYLIQEMEKLKIC